MIKHYKDLTPSDKEKFIARIRWEIENECNIPWIEMERKMQDIGKNIKKTRF